MVYKKWLSRVILQDPAVRLQRIIVVSHSYLNEITALKLIEITQRVTEECIELLVLVAGAHCWCSLLVLAAIASC